MGISGLLPLLKSVQKPTHLSELAGKTIAIDAYVWLHRGAYACATELVTGKYTTKYVDYAMHRVRLLQYHKITPYVVFDGGPLPAKRGTEVERKRKRDENFAMADALAKQGKHTQAREHYVKCVDITPQIAFQLIKALRAESIPYVVAPYEADAQLYHLERTGLAHGILTEDSDLLIFGTQLLLLKLDATTATCSAISASTLGSNSAADLPLHGWGIKELRECAMLSGCDYIEGVRGVGLKTAGRLLRRWGTVDKALRSLRMDGKLVERDWEERMRKAEVGFLNQRVWDPHKEEIVYLTEPDWATWDEEREKFVGGYIETELARRLARGDVDPATFEAMVDIMPSFQPSKHPPRPRPLAFKDPNRRVDETTPVRGPLFQYFAKQSKAATPSATTPVLPPSHANIMRVGRASGKRTLTEQYDRETTPKRSKFDENADVHVTRCSKFFVTASASPSTAAGPARDLPTFDDDKENLEELEVDEVEFALEPELVPEDDLVEQEEGYISPSPVLSSPGHRCTTPEFSSPLETRVQGRQGHNAAEDRKTPQRRKRALEDPRADAVDDEDDAIWGSENGITSPPKAETPPKLKLRMVTMVQNEVMDVVDTPDLTGDVFTCDRPAQDGLHVDLSGMFANTSTSGSSDADGAGPSHSPVTPEECYTQIGCAVAVAGSSDAIEDDIEAEAQVEERHKLVGAGWEQKYSNTQGRTRHGCPAMATAETGKGKGKAHPHSVLRRHETMITPCLSGSDRRPEPAIHAKPLLSSKPRGSDPLPLVMARQSWTTPLRSARDRGLHSRAENVETALESRSAGPSSQEAVVDDAGTTAGARMRLQAFRFR